MSQAAAANGKGEGQLPPTLKLMQQNTRLVVLTLEVTPKFLHEGTMTLKSVSLAGIWMHVVFKTKVLVNISDVETRNGCMVAQIDSGPVDTCSQAGHPHS